MVDTSDFDIAKEIEAKLKGKDPAQQERILRWVSEILNLPSFVSPQVAQAPQIPTVTNPIAGNKEMDIRSFANSKNPSSDQQVATVVAYYYKFIAAPEERKETINKDVLTNSIRLIGGLSQPKRPEQTLINAKNQGYLDSSDKGEYKINSVGENLVTMTLGNGARTVLRPKKTTKVEKKVRK